MACSKRAPQVLPHEAGVMKTPASHSSPLKPPVQAQVKGAAQVPPRQFHEPARAGAVRVA